MEIFLKLVSPTLMALIQKVIVHYYPQCSGMSSVLDDNDCENGNVTPLRYVPKRRSGIPSFTDLTGLDAQISSTADFRPHRRSTVAFRVKGKSTVRREKPTRSTVGREKPTRSTVGREEKPTRSTVGRKNPPQSTAATVHASADLMTSTIISMPDGIENENFFGNVDAMNTVV